LVLLAAVTVQTTTPQQLHQPRIEVLVAVAQAVQALVFKSVQVLVPLVVQAW
jgi:hypothetical protein